MNFDYRIPRIHKIAFIGICIIFLLGLQGESTVAKVTALGVFASVLIWIALSPRNRQIVIDDKGIEIPGVLLPPYGTVFVAWHDIEDVYTVMRRNGNSEMLIVTRAGKLKVRSWLIQGDFEISFYSEQFDKCVGEVLRRLPDR